jgi:EpsI family protein
MRGQSVASNLRFAVAVILLVSTALFLRARNTREVVPGREEFSSFPRQVEDWAGTDLTIPPDSLAVLGSGDFLLRNYRRLSSVDSPVDLFLAYFPSQRSSDAIHSPKHCLPGEGWLPVESREVSLVVPGQSPFPANRYLVARGEDRALVIYWYRARDRAVASEYEAKFYLISDSIRFNRSDGSLIRVSTAVSRDESDDVAQQRLTSLLAGVVPVLDRYIPR